MSESIWISDTMILLIMAIFGIFVAIGLALFFRYWGRVRNYIREKYPDKFEELGGLPFYAPMRHASFGTLFGILYGSENFNDPEFAQMKKKMKIYVLMIGLVCVILFLFLMIVMLLKFP